MILHNGYLQAMECLRSRQQENIRLKSTAEVEEAEANGAAGQVDKLNTMVVAAAAEAERFIRCRL